MTWRLSWRADPAGAVLADRHYNRQRVGSKQFVPPDVPPLGMVTFVDPSKVRSARPGRAGRRRGPGYCYLKAGFQCVGATKGGLLVFQMLPEQMPAPLSAGACRRRVVARRRTGNREDATT